MLTDQILKGSEIAFKRAKSPDSVKDHSLCESKVLGLSLTREKCYLDIGTMTIESVPHPLKTTN